jgi:hypothetical protein
LLESAAGRASAPAADLDNNLMKARSGDAKPADWLNYALGNTPFVNLAYVRPAMDFLFLNALRDSASRPASSIASARTAPSDYGQSMLYPQTIGGQ